MRGSMYVDRWFLPAAALAASAAAAERAAVGASAAQAAPVGVATRAQAAAR